MSENQTLDLDTASASIEQESAIAYASKAYLEYAMSVNKGRALPFAQDGLKPVHRRVLHAMNQLRLTPTSAPAKSARVVGEVIGKYHPHGDVSVYEAMVLTSQDFSMRYPLVDGQGNFGSRDGDGPAAMRYTEVRLSKYASLYLDEIDKGTVDYQPNYDGSQTEPKLTPARLPMLLANGSSGIGVGMACEFPSHNITEVSLAAIEMIKNKNATLDDVLQYIKAPDLPNGGQIISSAASIRKCYETGRGSLTVRAIYHFEELSRGQWQLVIDEIPPDGSVANVMEDIESIMNPKPKKDKKSLDQDQEMLKKLASSMVDTVRDASDKETKMRLVISPVSSKVDRDALLAMLFKHTKLESNISFNMVTVDGNGTPRSLNLLEILQEWIVHRFTCVTRRTQHRLIDVRDRIHILEGRMIVLLNIDEVIKIIRESDTGEAKAALMARFNLSDRQAEDILDMRLRQLSGLEGIKIEQDLDKLRTEETGLQELLDNPAKMSRSIVKQMEDDIKTYGDDRRTKVEEAASSKGVASAAPAIVDEPITLIFSDKGWIRSRQGHDIDVSALTFKEGDQFAQAIKCRSVDNMIAISEKGRAYSITAGLIPGGRGDGVPINTMFEFAAGDKLAYLMAGKETDRYLMSASNSYGFITSIGSMTAKNKAGKAYMTVKDNGRILQPIRLPDANEGHYLVVCGSNGKMLTMSLDQMKTLNAGGQGVTIMGLNDDEEIAAMTVVNGEQDIQVTGTVIGARKTANCKVSPVKDEKYVGVRARKGAFLPVKLSATSITVLGA